MDIFTSEEKAALEQKLAEMRSKRKQITQRIAEARALGDLSENAEYHAAREDQGLNEASIRTLEKRLAQASVADSESIPEGMVFLGSMVKLRNADNGDEDLYRLVGEATGRFDTDYIEVTTTSPMGEALLKARVGDTVAVKLPKGEKRFEVLEVS